MELRKRRRASGQGGDGGPAPGGTGGRACPARQPRQRTRSGRGEAGPGKSAQSVPGGRERAGQAATRLVCWLLFFLSALGGKEQSRVGKIANLFIKTGWH